MTLLCFARVQTCNCEAAPLLDAENKNGAAFAAPLQIQLWRLLFHFGRRFAVFVMQRHLADVHQVQAAPLNRVTVFVSNAQIPLCRVFLWTECDFGAFAITQRVFTEDVIAPRFFIGRRNMKVVNFNSGFVDQGEVLIAGAAGSAYGEEDQGRQADN